MPRSSMTIADRLSEAREAAGLTIAEAARRAAVSERTLKAWEAGKASPRPNKLQMLAGVLSVPMLWLLSGDAEYEVNTSHVSRIDELDGKVRRLEELQREITLLTGEISDQINHIRRNEAELEKLAS